jgi:hypothetical protein
MPEAQRFASQRVFWSNRRRGGVRPGRWRWVRRLPRVASALAQGGGGSTSMVSKPLIVGGPLNSFKPASVNVSLAPAPPSSRVRASKVESRIVRWSAPPPVLTAAPSGTVEKL